MAQFDAATERKTLDTMTQAFEYESQRDGGNIVASRLQDSISEAWCKLQPDQKKFTAAQKGTGANTMLVDGAGAYVGIFNESGSVVPFKCSE